jgi:hypothetical protein
MGVGGNGKKRQEGTAHIDEMAQLLEKRNP